MIKKMIIACGLLLLQAVPAMALPGKTLAETESWVKKHSFLSTWMTGSSEIYEGFPFERIAFRELQDRWFIDLRITFDSPGFNSGKSLESSKALHEMLYLVQKQYVGETKSEDDKRFDPRPWKDVACKNIWQRENQTAQLLLSKIYSPALANDFKTAKLAYQGPFYIPAGIGWGHEGPLWYPDKASSEDLSRWGMVSRVKSDVSIYIGSLYTFEVRSDDGASPDDTCIGLKINPRNWGVETAATLNHNFKMFQKWQQMQKAKEQRNAPANIKVE